MGTSVAPVANDPVAAYLQKYGAPPSTSVGKDLDAIRPPAGPSVPLKKDLAAMRPAAESTATNPVAVYLQKYGKSSSNDYSSPGAAGTVQKGAEALVSGVPGAQRAVAGYRGLLALLGGAGVQGASDEVNRSLTGERGDVASLPRSVRVPLQLTGSLPIAAALAPLGIMGGGAAYGAMAGADKPATSLANRATNTALGAVIGGASAKGGQLIGKGIANIADRTGVTDAVAGALNTVAPKLSAAMGTQGQVNQALGDRQDILDHLGDIGDTGHTAAQQQLSRIAATRAQAKVLYDAARNDAQVIQDPELQTLLSDPQIQKSYETVAKLRAASGNPLPTVATPEQVPLALQKLGVSPERYAELLAVGQQRSRIPALSGTDILPTELAGEQPTGVSVPDPDALARLRRTLWDTANGYQNSPLSLKQDEAQALLPKVDAIRSILHAKSPAWQQADQFYAGAKGEEEAFAHGFDAFKAANNQSGETLTTNSPEAMLKAIEEPRYPNEPTSALQERAAAFRLGANAAATAQVKGVPVDRGVQSILGTNALAPTQPAMQTRSLMFANPSDATSVEQTLARIRGESMALPNTGGSGRIPTSATGAIRSLVRKMAHTPDLLQAPAGQQLLTERLGDPQALMNGITASRATYTPFQENIPAPDQRAFPFASFLKNLTGTALGGQAAR